MAPWPALHRHQEMSLLTLAGNAETSKMEIHVRFVPFITSDDCKMIVIIWNYFKKKWNVITKDNSIFQCVVINKITLCISELTLLLSSDLMVKIINLYFLLAPNPAWSFHVVGRWGGWCDITLMTTNKTCTGLDEKWIAWTQNDQTFPLSLVVNCPWKPLGKFVKRSSSRAGAEQIWCLCGHSNLLFICSFSLLILHIKNWSNSVYIIL